MIHTLSYFVTKVSLKGSRYHHHSTLQDIVFQFIYLPTFCFITTRRSRVRSDLETDDKVTGKDKVVPVQDMKSYVWIEVQRHSCLASELDGGEWLISHSNCFTPGTESRCPLNRGLVRPPQSRSGCFEEEKKISFICLGSNTGSSSSSPRYCSD
jgi:hypothetical protein